MKNDIVVNTVRAFQNSIAQARQSIAARAGQMYDYKRDTWSILGYKRDLDFRDYLAMYERQDVAGRIVDMPAQETWRNPPKLVARTDVNSGSFFEDWEELVNRLSIWSWCEHIDRLSGIGTFGVLFIGVDDGKDLKTPVTREDLKPEEILYLSAYHEGRVEILEIDLDPQSVRCGLPIRYKIRLVDFQDPKGNKKLSKGTGLLEEEVHWTRVIHVAEEALSDRIYGRPRLQRVFNRMFDMLKVTGGSSEMFWQNVAQIFHVNLDPELEYKEEDLKDLDEKFVEMLQGIRRIIQTEGVEEIKTLQGKTPDPRGVFVVLKTLIASAAEIPQRILFGSEQGEMASTQDKSEWYGRITSRRERHAEPNILKQLVMRFASWGVLVLPEGGFVAQWPSLFEQTPMEKAGVARAMAMAAAKMDTARPDRIIGVAEIREAAGVPRRIPDDVKTDIEEVDKRKEEEEKKRLEEAATLAAAQPAPAPGLKVASSAR